MPAEAPPPLPSFRLSAATAIHRGDRAYQQDQVAVVPHPRIKGCVMGIVADGMGGKSGGRKAADQVMLTARQVFERFVPDQDDPESMVRQIVSEAHMMIKLTAITSEEEPHSTIAGFVILPRLKAWIYHSGDSRVYHFSGATMRHRTKDHSYVQKLVDEGRLTDEEALNHPKSNLLTACLGSTREPPVVTHAIERLEIGDSLMACSDGLWHYFPPAELGSVLQTMPARDASATLIDRARQRAAGGGDNLSIALVCVEPLK